jgi:hypothetical protein
VNGLTIHQLYQQGVQLTQAGWACENVGNWVGAGQNYQQALQAFDACGRIPGVQPVDRLYWVGACQFRLGWLTHLAGNLAWAQGWFNLARASLEQVCRLDPQNSAYQGLLGQVTQVGPAPAVQAVPQEARPPSRPKTDRTPPRDEPSPVLGVIKQGLNVLPDILKLFKGSDKGPGETDTSGGGWLGALLTGGGDGSGAGWGGGDGGWGTGGE